MKVQVPTVAPLGMKKQSALASNDFANDPDFTDPAVGIPALLAAEQPLLRP